MGVTVDRDVPSSWETFRLWRVSQTDFQFRSFGGQFLTCDNEENSVSATSESPSISEIFSVERYNNSRVHIKHRKGLYLQATSEYELRANYPGKPGWDNNAATFEMIIVANNLHGDYQLANGYGHEKAKEVLQKHRSTFITQEDFNFLSRHGINTVRIPVGWWISMDPNPPAPFIGGSLATLDNAFSWALTYNLWCIIDLHAAPGSQNGMEHSASRDGSIGWPTSQDYISQSLDVIDFLASRYSNHPSLLGIELLNEPSASAVPLDVLVSYYSKGYQIVQKYSSTIYVIICQRIGNADPLELYQANIGFSNIVVDLHYYNLFDTSFINMTVVDNIAFIYNSRQAQLEALNSANGPLVFIGKTVSCFWFFQRKENFLLINVLRILNCGQNLIFEIELNPGEWVNEWNVTSGSQLDYQDFGRAQLKVYDAASFGWAYWTLKNDRKHWDFEWNIRNNYLQLGKCDSSTMQIFSCILSLGLAWSCFYLSHVS